MGGRVVYLNWYIACQICWNTTLRVAWLIASNLNQQKFPTFTFLSFNEIDPPSTNICPAVFWLDLVITSAGNIVFSVWHVSGQSVSWPGSTRLPAVAIENECVQGIFLGFILCTVKQLVLGLIFGRKPWFDSFRPHLPPSWYTSLESYGSFNPMQSICRNSYKPSEFC